MRARKEDVKASNNDIWDITAFMPWVFEIFLSQSPTRCQKSHELAELLKHNEISEELFTRTTFVQISQYIEVKTKISFYIMIRFQSFHAYNIFHCSVVRAFVINYILSRS